MIGLFILSAILGIPIIIIPFVKTIRRSIVYWKMQRNVGDSVVLAELEDVLDAPIEKKQTAYDNNILSWEFPEILFMGIAPIMGIFLVTAFYSDIKPFHLRHTPTLFFFILIPYLSYWLSRYGKKRFSIFFNISLSYGMLIGCFLYLILFLHYLAPITLLAGAVFSFLAFPLFAPLPAFLYNIRELRESQIYLQSQDLLNNSWSRIFQLSWQNVILNIIITFLVIAAMIYIMTLYGQHFAAILLTFINSEGFLFSIKSGPLF